ncbi:S8 family peptidase [Bosea massiliensis]|uniref:S8 family peptidase n=1 Tax=Bosea massiliensis TaxID=151419 RepID=A0ABW0P957_9HYPH
MADNVRRQRHIHVRGLGVASVDFRSPGRGGSKPVPEIPDRAGHAESLRADLDAAVADLKAYRAAQGKAGLPYSRRGMPVTVEGRIGERLLVGKGRAGRGLGAFNVQRSVVGDGNANEPKDIATFFLTGSTLKSVRAALERYGAWERPDDDVLSNDEEDDEEEGAARRPPHFKLFETGAHIRPTTLRDLWTDRHNPFPRKTSKLLWEVWTRSSFEESFESAVSNLGVANRGRPSEFVDTRVRTLLATAAEIQDIVRASAAVLELRSASSFIADYFEMVPEDRAAAISDLAARMHGPAANAPVVTVLDTGVMRAHPLLSAALPSTRCHSADDRWEPEDHQGHGTKMAGIVQFGDIAALPRDKSPVPVATRLESVVVTAPEGAPPLPARDAIQRAVNIVETTKGPRVYCLAQTAEGEGEDGRPTSSSAVLDKLAFGDGRDTRLFVAAVGNAPHTPSEPYQLADYVLWNAEFGIQAPAQALNALSVGGASLKSLPDEGAELVAQPGNLAPSSRTAQGWPQNSRADKPDVIPTKPDIVMEGGNFVVDEDNLYCQPSPRHFVLTTSSAGSGRPLALVGETSAATAAAAGLAGRLLASYPGFRPETLRAMLVNSAEWTPAMRAHFDEAVGAGMGRLEARRLLLSRFGWGVPNEERLFHSARNALTLIAEDTLIPYAEGASAPRLKEMKYFKLPWPSDVLRSLQNTEVEMRVTLSFFVDPDPHAVSRDRIESYPSHRLRFDLRRYGESHETTQRRANELALGGDFSSPAVDSGWMLGFGARQRGTLHHDVWQGPAYQLVDRDGIVVAPVRGWWGDTATFDKTDVPVRFSLIVSIRTPEAKPGDLWTEVSAKVPTRVRVETPAIAIDT